MRYTMYHWENEAVRDLATKNWQQLERSGKKTSEGGNATGQTLIEMIRGKTSELAVMKIVDRSWSGFPNRKGSKEADIGGYIEDRNHLKPKDGVRIQARDHGSVWVLTSGPIGLTVVAHGWIDAEEAFRYRPKGEWSSFMVPYTALRKMAELRDMLGVTVMADGVSMGPEDYA